MFRHILVPTDGSELSERAAHAAIQLAKTIGAKVTAFYAEHPSPMAIYGEWVPPEAISEEVLRGAEKARVEAYLSFVADEAANEGVLCATCSEPSDSPYEAIIAVAADKGCDLIFMASHGRRGIAAVVLGSETHKVLVHSKIPVLVYR